MKNKPSFIVLTKISPKALFNAAKFFVAIAFVLVASFQLHAQTKEELQKKEDELRKEINELSKNLVQIQKNKKVSLAQVASVQRKIAAREELIRTINRRVRLLDETIYQNELEIYRMRKELDTLKQQYARSIAFAYKNRGNYQYLNFLFSSTSFNDALKRVTYLKSYRKLRETQVGNIVKTQQVLQQKIGTLTNSKNEQNQVLESQKAQLVDLEADKKEKNDVVKGLKGQEKEVTALLRKKEKQRAEMRNTIAAIIRREIAEAEKARLAKLKAETDARNKANAANKNIAKTTTTKPGVATTEVVEEMASTKTVNREYSALESTAEGVEMSVNFEKRNLNWPVSIGTVIAPFGNYQITEKLQGHSDGIEIAVPQGTAVKSVADGEVTYVGDFGGSPAVIVKHGKYFTIYNYLSEITARKSQQVKAGTVLGKSGISTFGEESLLFMVTNDKTVFLNPRNWLKSR
ncbi:MAG TPA: peptidoglycan DD-metalloendopeptidase family protein [Chitinophagaceae bacterium]|nr:peptidoglycan DD-metalloendopeptidase family protein [Chitinophagaceae bacterium]